MVTELYRSVDTVELAGVLPGIFGLDVPQSDLAAVVPVDQPLLVVDLDRTCRQQSDSVLPGDHVPAWVHRQLILRRGRTLQFLPLLLTRQGKVTSSPTLISKLCRSDWK